MIRLKENKMKKNHNAFTIVSIILISLLIVAIIVQIGIIIHLKKQINSFQNKNDQIIESVFQL